MNGSSLLLRQRGLTLLELLLALSIFSLVSVMAYGGLKTVLDIRAGGDQLSDQLAEIEMAFMRFERDFIQLVRRPVRGEYGDLLSPWIGLNHDETTLEFTWGGRPNPLQRPRASLVRVRYRWEEEQWIRATWSVLDRSQDSQPYEEVMLTGVEQLQWRFLGEDGEWYDEWVIPVAPVSGLSDEEKRQLVYPVAMELVLDWKGWGRVRRLFLFPGATHG